jgi:hypothetical protein
MQPGTTTLEHMLGIARTQLGRITFEHKLGAARTWAWSNKNMTKKSSKNVNLEQQKLLLRA